MLCILDKEKVTTFYEKMTNILQIMRKESEVSWIANNRNCSTNPH